MNLSLFRHDDGVVQNIVAIAYTLAAWIGGVSLIASSDWWINALGILVLAHSLVFAAYFLHEFAHGTVFRNRQANLIGGEVASWIVGASYAPFADLRRMHMRHHADRADPITFDYRAFLRDCPPTVRGFVIVMEYCYVPAVEFLMRGFVMLLPFIEPERRRARGRVVLVLVGRVIFFSFLAWLALKALLFYFIAYILFVTVLRFTDAYQHTFDVLTTDRLTEVQEDKIRDRAYEQSNTYSNLVSVSHPWMNLLLLNFGYHNAHHAKPSVPWHRLPALHREMFESNNQQVIPMRTLLKGFRRDRLRRVLSDDYGAVSIGHNKVDGFYGAVGVSFLTAV